MWQMCLKGYGLKGVQLMDPKMDTGFLKPGETMEDTYDTARELSPKECLGIMDELFCLEVRDHQTRQSIHAHN